MTETTIFHRGIASGDAFCNRQAELDRITKNIYKLTHTLLISPRRYGKTSLALKAIEQSKLPYAYIDLFMKYDAESINQEFFHALSDLMTKITKPTEKIIKHAQALLKNLSVSIKLEKMGLGFSLAPMKKDKNNLKFLLKGIDDFLIKNKKHVVIFIDEIQSIADCEIGAEVESTLRSIAQATKNISFIFSGSSRHLLSKLFEDRSRPLYKLCHILPLQRISAEHYNLFINKHAKRAWKQVFPEESLQMILHSTKLHPYYINILCSYLFEQIQFPTEEDIKNCWAKVCKEEQSSIAKELEFLTPKQKQLLYEIARQDALKEPTGKDFVKLVNLTPKGILDGIQILMKYDLIEKLASGEIRAIDPVLEYWATFR